MSTAKQDSNQTCPSPGSLSVPVPQRALRTHRPSRASDRRAASGAHLADIAHRLTPRDLWLARMLHEHRVLTSAQLCGLAFDAIRRANRRLRELYRWRVVDRFQPHRPSGTAPMHYVLDIAGAAALRHHLDLTPRQLDYRHDRALGIAHSPRLAHTVGVNAVFTNLIGYARAHPRCALDAWWSETRCAHLFGDLVRPDGYGRWHEAGREVEFFLEYDTGTEPLTRVAAKLDDYHRLAAATSIVTPVLFWFPTDDREANARQALNAASRMLERPATVPVATTHHTAAASSVQAAATATTPPAGPLAAPVAGARWTALGTPATPPRTRLAALPDNWARTRSQPTSPAPAPTAAAPAPRREGGDGCDERGQPAVHDLESPPPMPPDGPHR